MSSLITPSASVIDLNDPRLNEPIIDYSSIRFTTHGPEITERYQNAPIAMQNYALALARLDHSDWATRLLGCCRSGSEAAVCEHKKYANARRHHCTDPFCVNCSSGRYRFNKWASTRSREIFQEPHTAFELKIPGACACAVPWAEAQIHTVGHLKAIAWAMMEKVGMEHVTVDAFAEHTSDTAVRVVFRGTATYTKLQYWAERIANEQSDALACVYPKPQVLVKRGTPTELFHWAFNGFRELASLSADKKAQLRIELAEHRSVEACGDCYRPLSKSELAERAKAETESCPCPVCKDHNLTVIPPAERHARPIEDIMAEYDHVSWGREYDSPFLMRRGDLTDKDSDHTNTLTIEASVSPSPPS